jgi:predicted ferric reductase
MRLTIDNWHWAGVPLLFCVPASAWRSAQSRLRFSPSGPVDLAFSFTQLLADLMKRSYIILGFTAWLLPLSLAITSTTTWQRRLGHRWLVLHKLIYPAALLGAIHYLLLVKADIRQPLIYLGILVGLLILRVPWRRRRGAQTLKSAFSPVRQPKNESQLPNVSKRDATEFVAVSLAPN